MIKNALFTMAKELLCGSEPFFVAFSPRVRVAGGIGIYSPYFPIRPVLEKLASTPTASSGISVRSLTA